MKAQFLDLALVLILYQPPLDDQRPSHGEEERPPQLAFECHNFMPARYVPSLLSYNMQSRNHHDASLVRLFVA